MPKRNTSIRSRRLQAAKDKERLQKSRARLREQGKQLRELQRSVKRLQQKGIFSKRITDTTVINKYRKGVVKAFADVLKGTATTIKLAPKEAKFLRGVGERVKGNVVVKPVQPRERYFARKGRLVHEYKDKSGKVQRTEVATVEFKNVPEYLDALRDDPKWKRAEAKGTQIGFRFFGNQSKDTFYTIDEAIDKINEYVTEGNGRFHNLSPEDQQELFKQIEFTTVSDVPKWHTVREHHTAKRRKARMSVRYADKKAKYRAALKRTGHGQYVLVQIREKDRIRKQKSRATEAGRVKERVAKRRYRKAH